MERVPLIEEAVMAVFAGLDRWSHRLAWIDVKLLAVSSVFIGLLIAKMFPTVLTVSYWLLALVIVVALIHPLVVLFRSDS
jgi:hypothetical protein